MPSKILIAALATALILVGCQTAPRALPRSSTPVPGSSPGNTYGKANPGDYAWTPSIAEAQNQLRKSLRSGGASVSKTTDDRLWITLPGESTFEPKRSALKPEARGQLDKIAAYLRTQPQAEVRIVGHTDPIGPDTANNALSLERAASTRDWLVARGIFVARITVAGRGTADPIASNQTESGRASNRRVDLLIGERSRGL
jgi:outer membrane protein OmpA-like peptidoglycan-associated protein